MDPLRTYDYLAIARGRVFDLVRPLGEGAYGREFPIGPGTLGRTLTHVMISEWYYVQRMERREVPAYETWPIRQEAPPAFEVLEAAWAEQTDATRAALDSVRDWDAPIEYGVTTDEGQKMIVTASAGDLLTQLVLHEVHHRAQALNMLRHLGVAAGDFDFNAMMYPRRTVSK
jgi:uncharacterized damage-inducible protein DinB